MTTQPVLLGVVSFFLLTSTPGVARAGDLDDDVKSDAHDVKRSVNKTGHRVAEATCTGTKADCTAKKANHRLQETKEKTGDKVGEFNDKLR
jgi:hypothetical protein